MQHTFLIVSFLVLATSAKELLPESSGEAKLLPPGVAPRDECLICIDEINFALEECANETVSLGECIEDWLGASSDCLLCACEILDIISGSDICVDPDPGDCFQCVDDIQFAVDHCNAQGTSTLECVEDSLAAAAECIHCICDLIDLIDGGDGICPIKEEEEVKKEVEVEALGVLDCIRCQSEVADAIAQCAAEGTSTLECIELYLVAGSDCLVCVCELAGPIFGVSIDGCNPKPPKTTTLEPPPGDCLLCLNDILQAIEDCSNADTPTLQCVEDWLGAVSECIICICDIVAIIGDDPISGCEGPTQPIKNAQEMSKLIGMAQKTKAPFLKLA